MKPIILASTSPRRSELMAKLKLPFEAVSSDYEEDMTLPMPPTELAKYLSAGKAKAITHLYTDHLIIAADTFITLGDKIFGKPHTADKATLILREISGQSLDVISGLTIIETPTHKTTSRAIITRVFIKDLTDSEIANYVATGEPLDKAGAFGIQDLGSIIVSKIEGDYSNVMGLPLYHLAHELKNFGVEIL